MKFLRGSKTSLAIFDILDEKNYIEIPFYLVSAYEKNFLLGKSYHYHGILA